jgi:S1/P1 Nuclease
MRRVLTALLTSLFVVTCPAYPWWETGHRTIARIAAVHLTAAARTRLARILSVSDTPEAVADALAASSTWADEVKSQTKTGEWHYIDLTLQDHKSAIPSRCPNDNCAPARIEIFAAKLAGKGEHNQQWSELDALRYLVHFVGDIHQPLHAITDADMGGNCEHIDPPIGNAKNLHALWDGGIIREMNPDDKALAAELETEEIGKMSEHHRERLAHGDQNDWAWESHELAERMIYRRLHIPTEPSIFPKSCQEAPVDITNFKLEIDSLYINDMKPVIRLQLVKGGLRLARLLNESL